MIKVEPRLDELAVAHEGRRMIVVGCSSRTEHLQLMRAEAADTLGMTGDIPRLHLLAITAGIDMATYAAQHSMLPAFRVAATQGQGPDHGSNEAVNFSRLTGMQTQRGGAYICFGCVEDDCAGEQRHSWFHRVHHLVGVDWCPTHGSVLQRVEAPNPFDDIPQNWLSEQRVSPLPAHIQELPADGFLRRYVDIAVALLNRSRPLLCTVLNRTISDKAKQSGLRVSTTGHRPLISDRLIELVDNQWLQRHVPGVKAKRMGKPFNRIDTIGARTTVAATGDAYALVLAALYESRDEALQAITQSEAIENGSNFAPPKTVSKQRGEAFWHGGIWAQYLECRGSHAQLAKAIGMDRRHLASKLNSLGLPNLSRSQTSPIWRALFRYSDGDTREAACKEEYVDPREFDGLIRICMARPIAAARMFSKQALATMIPSLDLPLSKGNQDEATRWQKLELFTQTADQKATKNVQQAA